MVFPLENIYASIAFENTIPLRMPYMIRGNLSFVSLYSNFYCIIVLIQHLTITINITLRLLVCEFL